ncbi:MAG: DUF1573 domain-containing protein [Prevotella sp.]|nr:DUF1573 domain-containing protein [Prevotellaceae bacterium]MDY4890941.1 DUF1573 domain-containing protein [Prevotella sp.]MDY5249329.1 DUF1573 domain-containing protein [Prevotella sp.]
MKLSVIKLEMMAIMAAFSLNMAAQKIVVLTPLEKSASKNGIGYLDIGKVGFRSPVMAVFELKNKGSKKTAIDNVWVSCGCLAADYPKTEIAGGEKFKIRITYDAAQMGHFEKQVRIKTRNGQYTDLAIRGVVVEEVKDYAGAYPVKVGDLRIDCDNIEFDDVNKGDKPYFDIHIINDGVKTMQPNLMHMPAYLTAQYTPQYLRPGEPGIIRVTLNSNELHDYGMTQTSVYLGNNLGDTVSQDKEIVVTAVLLPSFAAIKDNVKQYAPKINLSAKELNLDFNGKKKKRGTIEITNNGRTALAISSLQVFTTGLNVTLGKAELQPGETTTLKITAIKEQIKKAKSMPRVLMITNDPDNPKIVIKVNTKN